MSKALVHRGPDDEGLEMFGEAGLAMRRLSIIDLERGHQPLSNEDRSVWIVFNGEIYNHRELRAELLQSGHRFLTSSDTEVIVHLYEELGDRLVDRLRGMFAFAIWDILRRRFLLARDRFGQKPLFYTFDGRRFRFASEIKALLAAEGRRFPVDLEALDDYLTLRFIPSPRTMFAGISKLPAGHLLILDASRCPPPGFSGDRAPEIEIRRYWRLRYRPKIRLSETEAVEEIRRRFADAVASHLIADVPVGAYLSGGMDSSLIVAAMSRVVPQPPATFSIGVVEQDFNELPYAAEVAHRFGTRHHEEVVSPDLVRLLPRIVHYLDEPSDPIAACMYYAASLAARHVKVVLSGDGGDEMFAGFDRYVGFRWVGAYAALPKSVRSHVLGPLWNRLPDFGGYKNLTQQARWVHQLSFHEGGRRYAEATSFFRFGNSEREVLYGRAMAERMRARDPLRCIVEAFEEADAEADLDRMLYADVVTRLPEHSLMLTDRMTMAHSIEGRSPFLDHELAEFVARLPSTLKVRRHTPKYLMRRVARQELPENILRRPKQGFMFPLGYWMKGPLLPVLRGLPHASAAVRDGLFRPEALERLVEEHAAHRADHHIRLWMILNVELWYRMYQWGESVEELSESLAGTWKGIAQP